MMINFTPTEEFLEPSLATACNASNFFVFMTVLNSSIRSKNKISGICDRVKPVESPCDKYDFIVVGGGAAGPVIAARLSEIFNWKVLLLEAGPDEPAGAEIPGFVGQFLATNITWDYKTTNESNACLSTNGSCSWVSGRNLGGNTAHHGMIYLRGNPTDYNNWAALGKEGWTWEEVKPFFLKAEDNGEIHRVGTDHHATGGPLPVERFPYLPPLGYSFLEAAEELGYGVSEDLNGDMITGFSVVQSTSKNGVRRSSASAYLRPVRNRKNLHVSLNSFVTKLIIKNKKAIGVEYHKDNKLKRVYATKEIIVSAGVVGSPHLLLLSGIGPKEHLESVGVEVIEDLPGVGENLHDHPSTALSFTVNEPDIYDNNWAVAAEYLDSQTGPMSGTGLSTVIGIFASNSTNPDYPDLEFNMVGYPASCAPGEIDALRSAGRRTIIVSPYYLHPKSRGRVSLASNDPFKYPFIWANYLSHSDDVNGMVQSIQTFLNLTEAKALQRHNFTLADQPLEACSDRKFLSDEYWACAVKQNFYPLYHQAGSCKMGNSSDPMAVVDPRLRVRGIKRLRVADGSIMPEVPSANTAPPIMMIGERAAHFIKEDWGRSLNENGCHGV